MERKVTTFDGSIKNRKNCRFIKGAYYEIGTQCFFLEDKWYRINSGFVVFNYTTKEWVLKSKSNLVHGVVGYDHMERSLEFGYFEANKYSNVTLIINDSAHLVLNHKILPPSEFVESKSKSAFIPISLWNKSDEAISRITFANQDYGFSLPYNFKKFPPELLKMIEQNTYDETPKKFRNNISKYIKEIIGDYSFGFEFETYQGRIPWYKLLESGLVPLRDGSIRGIEYATLPLMGETGIKVTEKACSILKDYTKITNQESLHLHIGNISKRNYKDFIARLFTICCVIEKEIYQMFPELYNKTSMFKERKKDYNIPLNKALASPYNETCFTNLSVYLAESDRYGGLGTSHPNDSDDAHKWNISTRYHWLNLVPAIFGKNNTVEFRVHVPTFNSVKVLNWLAICISIIKFAEKVKMVEMTGEELKQITLTKILDSTISNKVYLRYLKNYIEKRRTFSYTNDPTGDKEISKDSLDFDIVD